MEVISLRFILPMYDSVDEIPVEGHLSVDTRKVFASAALPKRDDTCVHQDNVIILTIVLQLFTS